MKAVITVALVLLLIYGVFKQMATEFHMSVFGVVWTLASCVFAIIVAAKVFGALKKQHGENWLTFVVSFATAIGLGYGLASLTE